MKFYPYCFILILILGACSFNNEEKFNGEFINNFPSAVEIEGTRVFESEMGIASVLHLDSLTIISTSGEPFIKVYDSNQQLISQFGKEGRGPGEFSMPPFIRDAIDTKSTTEIVIYDEQLLTLHRIDLRASIDSNQVVTNRIYEIPKDLNGAFDVFFVDSTTIVGTYDDRFSKQLDEKRGGFYYHPQTRDFETFPFYNLMIRPYEVMSATNINARASDISQNRNKFASVMIHYPGLEILEIGSELSDRYLLDSDPPAVTYDLETFKDGGYPEYYLDMDATDDYIYLLYSGYTYDESEHETFIQKLDWEGNAVGQYLIPSKFDLSMLSVDEASQCFYGLSYSNDAIYKFDYAPEK